MNEQQLIQRIRGTLDAGLALAPETAARLKVAREHALARHSAASAPEMAVARSGATLQLGGPVGSWAQVGLSVACLIVALVGLHYWQEARQAAAAAAQVTEEIVEVDTQVLTGDLPIKAYLDEDFQEWLQQSSQ
jgi:hypothetical protein